MSTRQLVSVAAGLYCINVEVVSRRDVGTNILLLTSCHRCSAVIEQSYSVAKVDAAYPNIFPTYALRCTAFRATLQHCTVGHRVALPGDYRVLPMGRGSLKGARTAHPQGEAERRRPRLPLVMDACR